MIHIIAFEIEDVGGYCTISKNLVDVIGAACSMAEQLMDLLVDHGIAQDSEWYNGDGDQIEYEELLKTSEPEELLSACTQIGDQVSYHRLGMLQYNCYDDLFDLIKDRDVEEWCEDALREKIKKLKKSYFEMISEIEDGWSTI